MMCMGERESVYDEGASKLVWCDWESECAWCASGSKYQYMMNVWVNARDVFGESEYQYMMLVRVNVRDVCGESVYQYLINIWAGVSDVLYHI